MHGGRGGEDRTSGCSSHLPLDDPRKLGVETLVASEKCGANPGSSEVVGGGLLVLLTLK